MHRLIAHLASLALLVHVLLGCCAHHDHQRDEARAHACLADHHAGEHEHGGAHDGCNPHSDENHGLPCSYILAGKALVRGIDVAAAHHAAAVVGSSLVGAEAENRVIVGPGGALSPLFPRPLFFCALRI